MKKRPPHPNIVSSGGEWVPEDGGGGIQIGEIGHIAISSNFRNPTRISPKIRTGPAVSSRGCSLFDLFRLGTAPNSRVVESICSLTLESSVPVHIPCKTICWMRCPLQYPSGWAFRALLVYFVSSGGLRPPCQYLWNGSMILQKHPFRVDPVPHSLITNGSIRAAFTGLTLYPQRFSISFFSMYILYQMGRVLSSVFVN